jgi:hypothetical protein
MIKALYGKEKKYVQVETHCFVYPRDETPDSCQFQPIIVRNNCQHLLLSGLKCDQVPDVRFLICALRVWALI